jgi:hypothetical protein
MGYGLKHVKMLEKRPGNSHKSHRQLLNFHCEQFLNFMSEKYSRDLVHMKSITGFPQRHAAR